MPSVESLSLLEWHDRLKAETRKLRVPFQVSCELTYRCHYRCVHCYNPTHSGLPEELAAAEWIRIFHEIRDLGAYLLVITGGEPFARPDLFEILKAARGLGFELVINTNAFRLDEERVAALREIGPELVSVTLFGASSETYERVTGRPGSYALFLRGMERLRDAGLPVLLKMPVMTWNAPELEAAQEWARSKGLPLQHSLEIHPRVDGDTGPLRVRLSPREAAEMGLRYGGDLPCALVQSGNAESAERKAYFECQCGKDAFAVSPAGEMNLCVTTAYPRYSLRTGSVREGWKELRDFVENFRPSERFECLRCDRASYCTQGRMDSWLATGDFNPCLPYFKEKAGWTRKFLTGRGQTSRQSGSTMLGSANPDSAEQRQKGPAPF